MMRRVAIVCACLSIVVGCIPPIRQFDLKNQALTCEQANDYTYRTLQAMDFTITEFQPAAGRRGTVRGTRVQRNYTQSVTVVITCNGTTANVDASEDGRFLGQLEFKRGFYLAFTAIAAQTAVTEARAREEVQRPAALKKREGLQILLRPVEGLAAKRDFGLDVAAGGVLPVRVTITNASSRSYTLDPDDVVLVQADGARVHPLPVREAAQRVAAAEQRNATADNAACDDAEVARRFEEKLLTARSLTGDQGVKGFLFFPLAHYVKGRVSLEDQESEESEGFVVEF